MAYNNIILAVELDSESDQALVDKAEPIIQSFSGTLFLVHAVEHMSSYGAAYGVAAGVDIETELSSEAAVNMRIVGDRLAVPEERQLIEVGLAKHVILEAADRVDASLIIVGSHGRHGVQLLLGSTANSVLHGAKCDVLALRVYE